MTGVGSMLINSNKISKKVKSILFTDDYIYNLILTAQKNSNCIISSLIKSSISHTELLLNVLVFTNTI